MTTVETALAYAARGWRVFPVKGKKPLVEWGTAATTDETAIRKMWDKRPRAGIGIATGNGLVVVDLDVHDPERNGLDNWPKLLADTGIDVATPVAVRTPSGGMHLYFAEGEQDWRNSAGGLAPGVDVRGNGGYVVAPGGSRAYEWVDGFDAELPVLPAELFPDEPVQRTEVREKRTQAYANTALVRGLRDVEEAEVGERNATLNRVAFSAGQSVGDGLLDEDEARALLWETGIEAGLEEEEVSKTIDSGLKSGMASVTDLLLDTDALSGSWRGPWRAADDLLYAEENNLPAIWGPPEAPLWMPGESLMVAGPSGVGKSTLAQQLVSARIGLSDNVLGYPVQDDGGRVLYLAMDRSAQVYRMLRRHVPEDDRRARMIFRERIVLRGGRAPVSMTDERHVDWLLEQAQLFGATTVVLDSLKNVVLKPSDEGLAAGYDATRQALMNERINLIEIHHTRKRSAEGRTQRGVQDDVYGSMTFSAGAGSILLLTPDKDEGKVWLQQVKSLAGTYRPTLLELNGSTGQFAMAEFNETLEARITGLFLMNTGSGVTKMQPRDLYPVLFPAGATASQQSQVRHVLKDMADHGELVKTPEGYMLKPA